jgi:23S rRNA pseudouridine1911/1915/1917 synthase
MSPKRGRQGREETRAKLRAAGVVPQLNARRRASKARAAEAAAEVAKLDAFPPQAGHEEGARGPSAQEHPGEAGDAAGPQDDGQISGGGLLAEESSGDEASGFTIGSADADTRLDQFLAAHLEGVSRSRVQLLIEQDKVTLASASGASIKPRASHKLVAGERIAILGHAKPKPLRAVAEDIPLDIIFEDDDLAVINKPAGMLVHAGSGNEPEDERGKGTLVNAMLHHLGSSESAGQQVSESASQKQEQNHIGDEEDEHNLRPGIVHRLDKQTSGVMVVAKNDFAHEKLSRAFAERTAKKHYIALVQGEMQGDKGTINTPISRDVNRRTRMTTRRKDGRSAVTHWTVRERLDTRWGKFTLLDVTIETGRTHQIRVHLSSVGHPVVGDTLYGAATEIKPAVKNKPSVAKIPTLTLERNFLHAESLALPHPRGGKVVEWHAPLPVELEVLLKTLRD